MGNLENKIFNNNQLKPNIYSRYIDNIFYKYQIKDELIKLKNNYEEKFVLKLSYKLNVNNKIPFLDVVVDSNNNQFKTTVYQIITNK